MTDTFLIGLIGAGIGASMSPALHEREAEINGLRLLYRLIDLAVLDMTAADTPALVTAARQLGYNGLNLTHPCKQAVLDHLDELSPDAAAIGAVNTVVFRGERSIGHNTDWKGFARSLDHGLPGAPTGEVVLVGAGGAGAAVAYALLTRRTGHITVVDIDRSRTDALVRRMAGRFGGERIAGVDFGRLAQAIAAADGVVHATPAGMKGHPGLPFPPHFLSPRQWVADLVYTPPRTELLRRAQALGCRLLGGLGMLAYQAAEAFHLFTGVEADAERMLLHAKETDRHACSTMNGCPSSR